MGGPKVAYYALSGDYHRVVRITGNYFIEGLNFNTGLRTLDEVRMYYTLPVPKCVLIFLGEKV